MANPRSTRDIQEENSALYRRISRETETPLMELHKMSAPDLVAWLEGRGATKLAYFLRTANARGDLSYGYTFSYERELYDENMQDIIATARRRTQADKEQNSKLYREIAAALNVSLIDIQGYSPGMLNIHYGYLLPDHLHEDLYRMATEKRIDAGFTDEYKEEVNKLLAEARAKKAAGAVKKLCPL